MLSVFVDLLWFFAGSALIGALVRAWRAGPDPGGGGGHAVPSWRAIVVYTLVALAFFSPGLLTRGHQVPTDIPYQVRPWNESFEEEAPAPKNPLLSDIPFQILPWRTLVRERFLDRELPLWAHEMGTGQPLLANAQSAPFAPLHLLTLPLPPLRGLPVAVAWQAVLALLLLHALVLRLGGPPAGAALAAPAFAFSTFSVAWAFYPMGMTAMWVPGVLLGLVLVAEGAPRGGVGLVVCGLGMALSGHPETLAHTAVVGAVVVAWLLVRRPRIGRGRFLVRLAGAGILTFALAAPFLLPILENLPASERAASLSRLPEGPQRPEFRMRWLAWLVDPVVGGNPREGGWAGPANFNEHASLYAGLIPLVLALTGALVLRGRVLAILLGGIVALLTAFRLDPLHGLLESLPLLAHGAHGRLRLFWILAVAVAAGLSFEAVRRSRSGRVVFAALLVLALGLVAGLGAPPPPWLRAWWYGALAGAGALLAFPWLLRWPFSDAQHRRAFTAVALAALALDLGLLGIRYNPRVSPELSLEPPPALAWMIERHREAMAAKGGPEPFRVVGEEWALHPNVPALYGLWLVRGNDPARPAAPARFAGLRLGGRYVPGQHWIQPAGRYDLAAQDYLGLRYLLTRHRRRRLPGDWEQAYRHAGGRVFENPNVLPLFFLPDTVERLPVQQGRQESARTALERALEIEDFARHAVVEVEETSTAPRSPPQRGDAELTRLGANRFELEVSTATGGVVVSSVSWDPGWRVRLDGESAPLLRANSAFLAFEVPPGQHRVRLVYWPSGWRWGLVLCGGTLLGLVAWGVRRRFSATAPAEMPPETPPEAPTPGAAPPPVGSRRPGGPAAGSPAE